MVEVARELLFLLGWLFAADGLVEIGEPGVLLDGVARSASEDDGVAETIDGAIEPAVGGHERVAGDVTAEVVGPLVEGDDAVADLDVVGGGRLGVVDAFLLADESAGEGDVDRDRRAGGDRA